MRKRSANSSVLDSRAAVCDFDDTCQAQPQILFAKFTRRRAAPANSTQKAPYLIAGEPYVAFDCGRRLVPPAVIDPIRR